MLKTHEELLEKIVALDGNCLDAKLCSICPFASRCLPDFLKTPRDRWTKPERLQMALDVLARNSLFNDDDFPEIVNRDMTGAE